MRELFDLLPNLKNGDYLIITIIVCTCFEIAPIKFNPFTLLLNLFTKILNWVGNQMMSPALEKFDKRFDDMDKRLDEVEKDIKNEKIEDDMTRIKDIRWHILNFAESLKLNEASKEQYEHVLYDLHPEYEMLLEKYDQTNGMVTNAINFIETKYQKLFFSNFN